MDVKVKSLQNDIDHLNPRQRITQAILPRLERTKERYSVEPDVYTRSGRRVLKKPSHFDQNLMQTFSRTKEFIITSDNNKSYNLKPIIHKSSDFSPSRSTRKYVNFTDQF
jgi:hypothetical protein